MREKNLSAACSHAHSRRLRVFYVNVGTFLLVDRRRACGWGRTTSRARGATPRDFPPNREHVLRTSAPRFHSPERVPHPREPLMRRKENGGENVVRKPNEFPSDEDKLNRVASRSPFAKMCICCPFAETDTIQFFMNCRMARSTPNAPRSRLKQISCCGSRRK